MPSVLSDIANLPFDPLEEDDDEFKSKSKKSKVKITAKPVGKGKKSKEPENIFIKIAETQENYLDCTSELSEEEYV